MTTDVNPTKCVLNIYTAVFCLSRHLSVKVKSSHKLQKMCNNANIS